MGCKTIYFLPKNLNQFVENDMLNLQTARSFQNPLALQFQRTRTQTEALVKPLSPEDFQLQSMPASPTKWHLAHLTWFLKLLFLKMRSQLQAV